MLEVNRLETITEKLQSSDTHLKGSIFIHVDHHAGTVKDIRFSQKHKEDTNTLDHLLTALGDALTDVLREVQSD